MAITLAVTSVWVPTVLVASFLIVVERAPECGAADRLDCLDSANAIVRWALGLTSLWLVPLSVALLWRLYTNRRSVR